MDQRIDVEHPPDDAPRDEIEDQSPKLCGTCIWAQPEACCMASTKCAREGTAYDEAACFGWRNRWRPPMNTNWGCRAHVRREPGTDAPDCPGWSGKFL